jgi:prevent-host-death family protein
LGLDAAPRNRLVNLGQGASLTAMKVNVGQAKTDLSKLLARAEAGEDVEIARNGVPVARLVRVDQAARPGERFLAARGSLAGELWVAEDFELTDAELDEMLGDDWLPSMAFGLPICRFTTATRSIGC